MNEKKIVFIGDTHDVLSPLLQHVAKETPLRVPIVHVGDIGLWPELRRYFRAPAHKIYFIEGNHDHLPTVRGLTEVTEIFPNLWFVPRGTVLEMNGLRVGFLGGATSVDRQWRVQNAGMMEHGWFADEEVLPEDGQRLLDVVGIQPLDLLVTHCPPASAINANFERLGFLRAFDLPTDWADPSALTVEWVWQRLGKPPLVCGHMHRSVVWENVRILDINEVFVFKK